MERICSKCGHRNETATGDEMEACPACAAIYSRAAQAQALAASRYRARSRPRSAPDEPPARTALGWIGLIAEALAWVGVIGAAITAALQLSDGLAAAESAPQQAAVAAVAVAVVAVPYCLARALNHLRRMGV